MIPQISTRPAHDQLTDAEQQDLIRAAQDVPVIVTTDEDGAEQVSYGATPASEAALERLTLAFLPMLVRASRVSQRLTDEDALGTVMLEFLEAVRRYDLASDLPFHRTIRVILWRRIHDSDRTSDIVVVKEKVAADYWRLLRRHNDDVNAAYAECRDTSNGLDPMTFLAVHRVMTSMETLDALDSGGDLGGVERAVAWELADPSPTAETLVIEADYMRWLFNLVTLRQETILRLVYGFCDPATENLRQEAGYRIGELLSDRQAGHALGGLPQQTVNRDRLKALKTMREAIQALVDEA